MADKHHGPGIVTLLVYLIGAASLTGGLSGWVHASGAYAWLTELNAPTWTPACSLAPPAPQVQCCSGACSTNAARNH